MKNAIGSFVLAVLFWITPWAAADWSVRHVSGQAPRIDLDVVDADPKDVLQTFARILEAELELDAAMIRPVTIRLRNVRVLSALGVLCESIDCQFELVEGDPARLRIRALASKHPERKVRPRLDNPVLEPISISLAGASLRDVLRSFVRIMEVEVDLPENIEGRVTIEMQDVPAGEALDQICAQNGLTWRLIEDERNGLKVRRLEIRRYPE